ncbi:MAG: hypothetical protein HYX27_10800 [Acidobacteria bacterium]|nr:hypothetical protein [Acidobacteriota bacterium]
MSNLAMRIVVAGLLMQTGYGETAPIGKDVAFRVQLTSGLNSKENKKGDKISAVVVEPQEYKGATMEGTVDEAKSSGKVNKSSTLRFSFSSLVLQNGDKVDVQSQVKGYKNSKGKEGQDDEGNMVEKSGNLGKVGIGTAVGAGIGALAGGGKGAAIGAGVGAAASVLLVSVAVKGPSVTFAPGSELELSVTDMRSR